MPFLRKKEILLGGLGRVVSGLRMGEEGKRWFKLKANALWIPLASCEIATDFGVRDCNHLTAGMCIDVCAGSTRVHTRTHTLSGFHQTSKRERMKFRI